MTHKIAVIGGDGIGPEVTAEAVKVVRAAGVDIDTTEFDLGGAALPARRRDPVRRDARCPPCLRLHPARRGRHARGATRGDRAGATAQDALRARPVHQPAPVRRHCSRFRPGPRLRRDPGEHRGPVRRRRWGVTSGHAPRGRHPGVGQHPHGRRALRPLRVRAGRRPGARTSHARPQDQRADLRRRAVGAHLQRGRRRVPGGRQRPTTTSTPPASTSCRIRSATT